MVARSFPQLVLQRESPPTSITSFSASVTALTPPKNRFFPARKLRSYPQQVTNSLHLENPVRDEKHYLPNDIADFLLLLYKSIFQSIKFEITCKNHIRIH